MKLGNFDYYKNIGKGYNMDKYEINDGWADMYKDLLKNSLKNWNDDEETEDEDMGSKTYTKPIKVDEFTVPKGAVYIQPAHGGFLVITNPEGNGKEVHCFENIQNALTYIGNIGMMDLTESLVAENV